MAADVLITLDRLPWEVIEYVLEKDSLEVGDIFNFALTCRYFYKASCASNRLWRIKFFQKWPGFVEIYERSEKVGRKVTNWMDEFRASMESRRRLMKELSLMSKQHYKNPELSHSALKHFDILFRPELGAHHMAYHFLVDELISLIESPALTCNLTYKHYAYKVVRYLRQRYLTDSWQIFTNLPPEKQILEYGAVLISQWSQPEKIVLHSRVSSMLDSIAEVTKLSLRKQYPNHPIFSVPPEVLAQWKHDNIDDNQYGKTETRQVMTALCEAMFEKMGFHGTSQMYYSSVNSFIDQVLEHRRGIPITLAIVFESVARRLGVRCEPISFPAHFLLRWKESYNVPDSEEIESFYIDVFNGGQFITKKSCPRIGGVSRCPIERYNIYHGATAVEVVQRMANNLEVAARQRTQLNGRAARLRSALELLYMVRPFDTTIIQHLASFYMLHQMDLGDIVDILTTIPQNPEISFRGQANHILQRLQDYGKFLTDLPQENIQPKVRSPEIKFAVGMIMKHRSFGYLCVITGWDQKCQASAEWMDETGVNQLSARANQPFYNLFVDGGLVGYAAEENLVIAPTPAWVDHDEIGRYFSQFCGTHYVPNDEKEREYPFDAEFRALLLAQ